MSTSTTDLSHDGTDFNIWIDDKTGRWQLWSKYSTGTQLLRDAAHKAEWFSSEYLEKKEVSQRGWKSRREIRG